MSACRPVSHVLSKPAGRAFSAGKDPTMPALHCAATRAGPLAMNSGAPMPGKLSFCNPAGNAMKASWKILEKEVRKASEILGEAARPQALCIIARLLRLKETTRG